MKKLHVGKLRVYPDEECEKIYDIVDKEYHICASGQYGTKATCKVQARRSGAHFSNFGFVG